MSHVIHLRKIFCSLLYIYDFLGFPPLLAYFVLWVYFLLCVTSLLAILDITIIQFFFPLPQPVSQNIKVDDHHPGGGHWFAAGLSPNVRLLSH